MPTIKQLKIQYGGDGIPFSAFEDKKKKSKSKSKSKKKKKLTKKPRPLSTKKTKQKTHKLCHCKKHTKHIKDPSPNGLGKCAECSPLHIIIKGKNKKLWENQKVRGKYMWVQVY